MRLVSVGRCAPACCLWWLLAAAPVGAQQEIKTGVTADTIRLGESVPLSGPTAAMGRDFSAGLKAALEEANSNGGVEGRRLELIALDDGYRPERAARNTKRLIEEDGVFAIVGTVGTASSIMAAEIASASGIPFVGPQTGASYLRDSTWTNIVHLRASYEQETRSIVSRLVTDLNVQRVAVLFQDDSYGRAGLEGVRTALRNRGLRLAAVSVYPRNTSAVKTGLLDIREADPEAIIMIGAAAPVAETVKWARHMGMRSVFATISFSASSALLSAMGRDGEGVYVTQVVASPYGGTAASGEFRRSLREHGGGVGASFVSFEGYLAGRVTVEGLQRAGRDLTRQGFLEAILRGPPVDVGGISYRFEEGSNQGSSRVSLFVVSPEGTLQYTNRIERR